MHLLIPFASALSDAAVQSLQPLELPNLSRLLSRMKPGARIGTDEYSLTPPHERAEAEALGLRGGDGALPWAARSAQADGLDIGEAAWGLLTPVHWSVGREKVSLADPQALNLDDAESRALMNAVESLFAGEGFALAYAGPLRWYASHESLDDLPTASLDRVIGRNVDLWMGQDPRMRLLRRLQSEVQMTLYTHPINDEREARGELPVNSFWLSGCGRAQPTHDDEAMLAIDRSLRAPLFAEDWAGWVDAWKQLDAGPLAELLKQSQAGEWITLTLAGERHAQTFESAPISLWKRLSERWQAAPVLPTLQAL